MSPRRWGVCDSTDRLYRGGAGHCEACCEGEECEGEGDWEPDVERSFSGGGRCWDLCVGLGLCCWVVLAMCFLLCSTIGRGLPLDGERGSNSPALL